jgi:hypothetical protein
MVPLPPGIEASATPTEPLTTAMTTAAAITPGTVRINPPETRMTDLPEYAATLAPGYLQGDPSE